MRVREGPAQPPLKTWKSGSGSCNKESIIAKQFGHVVYLLPGLILSLKDFNQREKLVLRVVLVEFHTANINTL